MLSGDAGFLQLGAGKPARIFEFGAVNGQRRIVRNARAADHQLAGERPWLAGKVTHIAHPDASFLVNFAGDGFFYRFAWFDEAGERRVHFGWEPWLATEQKLVLMFH